MATPAARLTILINAETGKATAALRKMEGTLGHTATTAGKATKNTDRFSSGSRTLGSHLATAAKYAAGAAAAYVGISEAKTAVTTTEDLAKATLSLHKNLGLSVRSSSEWAAVAKTRGVDSTKLGMAFKTLATQITSARDGSASASANFKKLGFSQRDIAKGSKDTNFLLMKTSDGLHNLGAGADKAAISGKLFGRGWQTVAPILRDGSKSMQEQLDLANKYGASFGGKSLKSVYDLVKAQRELALAQLGLQIAFTEHVAPALIKVGLSIAHFINQMRTGRGAGGKFAEIMRIVGKVLAGTYEVVRRAVLIFIGIVNVVKNIVHWFHNLPGPVKDFGKVLLWIAGGPLAVAVLGIKLGIKVVKSLVDAFHWVVTAAKNFGGWVAAGIKGALNQIIGFVNDIIGVLNKIPFVEIGKVGVIGGSAKVKHTMPNASGHGPGPSHRQRGGIMVPGQGSGDKVPAMLEPGEVVINRKAVAAMGGAHKANQINRQIPRFAAGGIQKFGIGGSVLGAAKDAAGFAGSLPGKALSVAGQGAGFFINQLPHFEGPAWLANVGGALTKGAANYIKDKVNIFGGGGGLPGGGGNIVALGRSLQRAGYEVGEHPAFGGVNPVHVAGSYHYSGRAIDVNDDSPPFASGSGEPGSLDRLNARLKKTKGIVELLWRVPHHFDHLHVAMQKGGVVQKLKEGGVVNIGQYDRTYTNPTKTIPFNAAAAIAESKGLPGKTFAQIAIGESGLKPGISSSDGGYGLWQMTPRVQSADTVAKWKRMGSYFNPLANAAMGKLLYDSAGGISPWYGTGSVTGSNLHYSGKITKGAKAAGVAGAAPRLTKQQKRQARHDKRKKALDDFLKLGAPLGLTPGISRKVTNLRADIAQLEEFAGNASSIGTDTAQGIFKGKTEAQYLTEELQKLLVLRNTLVAALAIMQETRDTLGKQLVRMHKELAQLKKVKKPNKHQRDRMGAMRLEIPNAAKALTDLTTAIGSDSPDSSDTVMGLIAGLQGTGGPLPKLHHPGTGFLTSLSATPGDLGGQILQTQLSLREVGASGTAATDNSAQTELLAQLLKEANQRTAVSQAQYEVFKNFPPFGGVFHQGGVVPGPIGAERMVVAKGGEMYAGQGGISVLVHGDIVSSHPNPVEVVIGDKRFAAAVEKVGRRQARGVGRTPGSAGSLRG